MRVEIDDREVKAALNRLLRLGEQPGPVLHALGRLLKTRVQLGFQAGRDPYGNAWLPLRSRRGRPLRDTGRLMNSITYQVQGETLTVGTNVAYAPTHQFGATISARTKPFLHFVVNGRHVQVRQVKIPARPMFPLSGVPKAWQEDMIAEVNDFIAAAIKR